MDFQQSFEFHFQCAIRRANAGSQLLVEINLPFKNPGEDGDP